MNTTFFSIIIPTYNRANYILSTIQSALEQNYEHFEVIIIDDGSTDNTEDLIRNSFPHNKKIIYHKQINSERGAARNKGIKISSGNYLVFLDSDDVFHKHHLKILREIIKLNPQANFIATKYDLERNGKRQTSSISKIKQGWYGIDLLLKGNPFACNFCIKKSNPNLKFFEVDRKYATMEDWLFLLINLQNDNIYISDETTVILTDHDERSMRNQHRAIVQKRLLANEWAKLNLELTESQKIILDGYSFYFCAIHCYIGNYKRNALSYLIQSTKKIGITFSAIILFLKILIGYNFIQRFK